MTPHVILELTWDPQLSYDEHISKTVSSCVSCLCQINRVKHAFDKKTLKLVINALVFSRLFSCSTDWCNIAKKNVNKLLLQNLQRESLLISVSTIK